MTASAQRLIDEAMGLSVEERAEIAAKLIHSLDAAQESDVADAWDAEIARRIEDLDSGRVKAISMDEFWRRVTGYSRGRTNDQSTSGRSKRSARRGSMVSGSKPRRRGALRK